MGKLKSVRYCSSVHAEQRNLHFAESVHLLPGQSPLFSRVSRQLVSVSP